MSMRKIYRQIAKKHHVSVKEVKADMESAIQMAWTTPDRTPEERARQQAVPSRNDIPTPEELISYLSKKVK